MMQYIIMAAQLLTGLSLLVFVHELGHFLAAKMFGIRVTKFYIFFDAWGKKLFSKQIGETEYGFGWLPLGGYVQIAGMVDETQDSSKLSATPESWEFRSKPAWQRLIVMLGGIIMNIITGLIIFFFYLHQFEKSYTPVAEINKDGIFAHKLAQKIGFETGDKIMSVNGETPVRFEDVLSTKTILGGTITVERQGQMKTVQIPDDFYKELATGQKFIEPMHQEIFVEEVAKG
ncbi:MAG TPA: site-2 protease family protein, partial [Chitinophagales bacterium]|nr:site-2 protease family protein [Chitinophagales bacterium]